MGQYKISAFITCRNEEDTIGRALESLSWADELIVIDGGSTDKTVEISKAHNAKVVEVSGPEGRDIATCRNIALKHCAGDWVYYLDADEVCSPEFIAWVKLFKEKGEGGATDGVLVTPSQHPLGKATTTRVDMFEVRRLEHFRGRLYRFGAGNPSHQWRLFRNTPGIHFKGFAHEYPVFEGEIRRLEKPILHYPMTGLDKVMNNVNRASSLDAEEMFKSGVIHRAPYMFFSGVAMFLKSYFRKQGFRDGIVGFIFSVMDGGYFFLRQAKLYVKNREAGRI